MRKNNQPKHVQLEQTFRQLMESGHWKMGQRLPSELALSAEHACSPGTVRRALATLIQDGVLEPRQRVGLFVREKPHQRIIGVIVPNLINPDHAGLVEAVTQAAANRGYSVSLFCAGNESKASSKSEADLLRFIDRLAAMHPAGIIACPTCQSRELKYRAHMRALQIPYVVANDYWTDCRADHHVCVDQEAAVRLALDHLAGLGHRQIALWMCQGDEWPALPPAFLDHLKSHKLPYDPEHVFVGTLPDWMARLQAQTGPDTITAVVVPYYEWACRHVDALQSMGWNLPHDLSLISLGAPFISQPRDPDLTATVSPIEPLAERALRILCDGEKNITCQYRFTPTLRIGTTAAAPSRPSLATV